MGSSLQTPARRQRSGSSRCEMWKFITILVLVLWARKSWVPPPFLLFWGILCVRDIGKVWKGIDFERERVCVCVFCPALQSNHVCACGELTGTGLRVKWSRSELLVNWPLSHFPNPDRRLYLNWSHTYRVRSFHCEGIPEYNRLFMSTLFIRQTPPGEDRRVPSKKTPNGDRGRRSVCFFLTRAEQWLWKLRRIPAGARKKKRKKRLVIGYDLWSGTTPSQA